YAPYDRELEISPKIWNAIAARTVAKNNASDSRPRFSSPAWFAGLFAWPRLGFAFSGAMAVLILAVVFGVAYLRTHQRPGQVEIAKVNGLRTTSPGTDSKVTTPASPDKAIKTVTGANESRLRISSKSNLRVSRK